MELNGWILFFIKMIDPCCNVSYLHTVISKTLLKLYVMQKISVILATLNIELYFSNYLLIKHMNVFIHIFMNK